MKVRPCHTSFFLAAIATWNAAGPLTEGASLEGKQLSARLNHKDDMADPGELVNSGIFVVGPGVELQGFGFKVQLPGPDLPALVDVDISDKQMLVTLIIDQPFAFQEVLTVVFLPSSMIPNIRTLTINPATNWIGFTNSRAGNLEQGVSFNVSQLRGLKGQQILVDMTFIPEPGGAWLASAGVAVAMLRRRKRRRAAG